MGGGCAGKVKEVRLRAVVVADSGRGKARSYRYHTARRAISGRYNAAEMRLCSRQNMCVVER